MKPKSYKFGLVLLTVLLASSGFAAVSVSAQPVEVWNITWGGTNDDSGRATATGDSVYLAGKTGSYGAGNCNAFLNKYNSTDGSLIWNRTWGGTGWDEGYATATGDSVYLAGKTESYGAGSYDAFLNKYNSTDGELIWNLTWGGTSWDCGRATATGDSVYLAGWTESYGAGSYDAFLNKYNSTDGELIWNRTWGGTGDDRGYATATGDSVYLAGVTYSYGAGSYDAFLNKYNSTDGTLIWNRTWGGTGDDRGYATATGDSVYLAGYTNSYGAGNCDAFLNKYNSTDGTLIWNLTWGGTSYDYGYATATGDSVYLAGGTESYGAGSYDAFLNKYDSTDGTLIWNLTWGGTGNDKGYATATGDSVYLAGWTESYGAGNDDAFLVKFAESGPEPPIAVPDFSTTGLVVGVGMLGIVLAVTVFGRRRRR